ncbi:hypothetical protein [Flavobacterium sp.]|uniref:hypothetical protein n=1 Tax=Flavobacterium sp. TaxID=239 RepID=UPI0026127A83|nr:hypothetical protein [Flavobacterium sp.]MDD2985180.1 hypothetical protein [Flavobacterium sp.]
MAAQNSIKIRGLVKVENASAEGIHVLNLVSEKATVTDAKGGFFLEVKEDDLVVFSAVHLNYWRKSITAKEIQSGYVEVEMTAKENQLDEVVVSENVTMTAQSLGIITYKPKVYTPAERRIRTATSGVLDPLINWISGRTKDLKKQLEIEKRERYIMRLESYFDDAFFMDSLKIPEVYVGGFKYYVVEDGDLAQALTAKNKDRTHFLLGELAQEFLIYIEDYEK